MSSWLPASVSSWLPGSVQQKQEIVVSDLWIYPIKSCRGFKVQSSEVTPEGLKWDRHWMLVEEQTHRFLTARTIPKMILIETAIDYDAQTLTVTVPATASQPSSSHTISLTEKPSPDDHHPDFTIWGGSHDGYSVGTDAMREALSTYMGRPVLLVQKGEDNRETGDVGSLPWFKEGALEYDEKTAIVSWADEYPILLMAKSSVEDIEHRVKTDIEIRQANATKLDAKWEKERIELRRFRGNIVVEGTEAWEEEGWSEISIENASGSTEDWIVATLCGRCQLPNVDPVTAIRDPVVPDKFMEPYRKTSVTMPDKLIFGVNCVPTRLTGKISVGDKITVTRRYEERRPDGTFIRHEDAQAS